MAYFDQLPTVFVADSGQEEKVKYKEVKNIFRRVILPEKMAKYATLFNEYYIPDGMRPDMVAQKFYGDPELDWIILLSNNITDVYTQWPKRESALNEYVANIYDDPDSVHHWETVEVKSGDIVITKSGIEVNESYRGIDIDGNALSKDQSIYPVSNYEHESYLNEKSRLISIPTSRLVDFYEEQFKDLVDYQPHDEVDDFGRKKTHISLASAFLDRDAFRRSALSNIQAAISNTSGTVTFDYGDGNIVQGVAGTTTTTAVVENTVTTTNTAATTTTTTTTSSTTTNTSSGSGY
tara:strand:+ start:474 stop:1352 length:879 start_codon:yes stop_codon:yes gene_type:complete